MGKLTSKEGKQNISPFSKAIKGQKLDSNLGQVSKINRLTCGRNPYLALKIRFIQRIVKQ